MGSTIEIVRGRVVITESKQTLPPHPIFPEECRGMMCGAKTRVGTPCKRKDLFLSGRCKFHGGMSTGPVTTEGKRKAANNGMAPKGNRT